MILILYKRFDLKYEHLFSNVIEDMILQWLSILFGSNLSKIIIIIKFLNNTNKIKIIQHMKNWGFIHLIIENFSYFNFIFNIQIHNNN